MTKLLKIAGLIICIGILVFVVTVGVLVTVINPNKFKPALADAVYKRTGHHLVIDGDIAWSLYPNLGIKVGHMVLENAPGFQEAVLAEISQATVGVKLLPLLHAKVQSTGVSLVGLKLNMIKNAKGAVNWQLLPEATTTPVEAEAAPTNAEGRLLSKTRSYLRSEFALDIPVLDVTDAAISWQDARSGQTAAITRFNLHANNISLNQPFAIIVSCHYDLNHAAQAGDFTLNGHMALDLHQQRYTIDGAQVLIQAAGSNPAVISFSGDVAADLAKETLTLGNLQSQITNVSGVRAPIQIQGAMVVNTANQTAQLTGFKATIADLAVQGNVNVTNLSTVPAMQGHLQVAPFNLKKWLQDIGQDKPELTVANNVTANVDFSATTANMASPIQAVTMNGDVNIDTLEAAKLKANHLKIRLQLQNGVMAFAPVTAALYDGSLTGEMKVTLTGATPQIAANLKLANVQAEPLLRDLGSQSSKIRIQGAANVNLQITTAGTAPDAIMQNLNGNASVSFKEGQLTGVNIGNMIDSAVALIKHQSAPANKDDATHFGDLTATATIHNGVLSNNDLHMNGPRFDTRGKGTVNLVQQTIDYRLETSSHDIGGNNKENAWAGLNNITIPVTITGSLNNPRVQLDAGAILAQIAKVGVQNAVQTKAQELNNKLKIPGGAGAVLQNLFGH